ncbi:hypothetical protein EHS25_005211 [Saitozyma podzolica]|uniref:Uncharacterized protein n=1 Tax=Saitozyma podzolica TaxID=1890683 RepID=A0A427XYT8_9TREE|nr:hypothetical protein EHS25_005211 [Saitozyma podzolica]
MPSSITHPEPAPDSGITDDHTLANPCTPPPSLTTDTSSSTYYSRPTLLSLAQSPLSRPPNPVRLNSFSAILRRGTVDDSKWGIDEEHSDILDGKPIAACLPIPVPVPDRKTNGGSKTSTSTSSRASSVDSVSGPAEVLFAFQSMERAAPILINFNQPDPFGQAKLRPDLGDQCRRPSAVFQTFPSSISRDSSSTSLASMAANSMGDRFSSLRETNLRGIRSKSRSGSVSSTGSGSSFGNGNGLNPFAPPFPLPNTTPAAITPPREPAPSLPLPKTLPASLPKRPGPIAPVFVKRESATLPQPMAVKDVAPLGSDWSGEAALSGNEKRRRASEMGLGVGVGVGAGFGVAMQRSLGVPIKPRLSSVTAGFTHSGGPQLPGEHRPERLVRLGQSLRQSMAVKGAAIKTQ